MNIDLMLQNGLVALILMAISFWILDLKLSKEEKETTPFTHEEYFDFIHSSYGKEALLRFVAIANDEERVNLLTSH